MRHSYFGCVQAVEATADAQQLVYKYDVNTPEHPIQPIDGYVVILGQNLAVHGQEQWRINTDHTTWDGAHSIPSLDQSAWRHDKVA